MIILENNKYVVSLPEHGLWQDINPDKHGLPFESKKDAEKWEAAWLAAQEAAQAARLAEAEAQKAASIPEVPQEAPVEVTSLSEAEFRRIVLTRLGIAVKEV